MTDSERPAKSPKATGRRVGSESSATRAAILDATEKLMMEEGYAAVSSRRVAAEVGVKASLIHYYFPTTDDLFLELYRRMMTGRFDSFELQGDPVNSLPDLWQVYQDRARTGLALEFMALANHRKVIRDEIARQTDSIRQRRAELLAELVDEHALQQLGTDAAGLSVLLIGVARTLVMEENLGVSNGHQGVKALIEQLLTKIQK